MSTSRRDGEGEEVIYVSPSCQGKDHRNKTKSQETISAENHSLPGLSRANNMQQAAAAAGSAVRSHSGIAGCRHSGSAVCRHSGRAICCLSSNAMRSHSDDSHNSNRNG
ncbi:hypothetical protein D8674_039531 [Pyrus ussuriensis x Pyrus communis]|uniref:Uncharacterized protein n=1 Tax=Pyrus ussuriensis x Pyrus communis TaxID=2448454 RepID=A0A5N5H224_9ROSA|nr:hypothetical protein D8674_039531 [Pyrus ussuriensis x Pyrus communis]